MARVYSEKNTAARERGRAKREATSKIVDYILNNKEDFDKDIIEAANFLVPKKGGGVSGARTDSKKQLFLDMLKEKGIVHEDDLFLQLKLGRVEARNIRNELVKTLPEDRIWISFDKDSGNYTISGTGADVPDGYDGYIPNDIKLLDEDDEDDFDMLEDDE